MARTPDDGSGPLDVDAAFAEIVAHWGEDAPAVRVTGPSGTDGERPAPSGTREDAEPPQEPGATGQGTAGTGTAGQDAAGPDGEGPARPEPRLVRPAAPLPPPPREDPPGRFAAPHPRDDEPAELRALTEDGGFVPDDPQPLPRDVLGWAAWIAVVGAPLFLLVVALAWRDAPQLITAVAAGVFVAGFATLVIRLPGSRDDDDDDGAVV